MYFEAVVKACGGSSTPVENDELPGGHTDYVVAFGEDRLSCELKSVSDSSVTSSRKTLRDMIVEELKKRSEMLWVITDGRWRDWIESKQMTGHSRVAKRIVAAAIEVAKEIPAPNTGQSEVGHVTFDFGVVKINVQRANTAFAYVSEFERIDLAKRIREVLGKARLQHKTSTTPELPLVVVLFLRDWFDDISELGTALCGDFTYNLRVPTAGSVSLAEGTPGRTNRFFAPHKNTSVSAVLYVPCGPNWSNSPVTLILNPFARHPVSDSWFSHPEIARQEIDLTPSS